MPVYEFASSKGPLACSPPSGHSRPPYFDCGGNPFTLPHPHSCLQVDPNSPSSGVHFLHARLLVVLLGRLSFAAVGGGGPKTEVNKMGLVGFEAPCPKYPARLMAIADSMSALDCCHWALLARDVRLGTCPLCTLSGFGWGRSVLGRGDFVEAPHLPSLVTGGETRSDPCRSSLSELLVASMFPLSPY